MTYVPKHWENGEDGGTPITAAELNRIEAGIAEAEAEAEAALATPGTLNYSDLVGKPTLATVATTGSYSDLVGKPALATVATSGSYTDLINVPTVTGYTDEQVRDVMGTALVPGSNVSISVNDAADTITISASAGSGGGTSTTGDFGAVSLDSFAGATDDAKLTAALSSVGADTYKRTILLSNRQYNFATVNRAAFDGMRIAGPSGYSNADKGTANEAGEVHLTGSGPWFHNNGSDVYDVSLKQLAFKGGSGASVLGMSGAGSWWRLHMRDIAAASLKSVLGSQSTSLLMTGAHLDGFWEVNNCYNSAFHLGGSDNRLFSNGGFLDSDPAFATAGGLTGAAHLWCDYLENSTVGPLYITCESLWTGIQITGPGYGATSSQGGPISFYGLQVEGRNQGQGSNGAVVRQDGGIARFRDCNFHFGMISPTGPGRTPVDAGMIHHAGGQLIVSGATYDRATGVSQSTPFVYTASAGKCLVSGIQPLFRGGTWTGLPVVGLKSGVTENRITDATVTLATI